MVVIQPTRSSTDGLPTAFIWKNLL
jgi:hypothetical protein